MDSQTVSFLIGMVIGAAIWLGGLSIWLAIATHRHREAQRREFGEQLDMIGRIIGSK